MHAHGHFDVKVVPQTPDNEPAKASGLMRLSLDKQFHGALDGASRGEMLATRDATQKNGAYVALESFSGTLDGHSGGFALVHRALMRDGESQEWTVAVVPGSGSGALAGRSGSAIPRAPGTFAARPPDRPVGRWHHHTSAMPR